jgi:hypothetical protein
MARRSLERSPTAAFKLAHYPRSDSAQGRAIENRDACSASAFDNAALPQREETARYGLYCQAEMVGDFLSRQRQPNDLRSLPIAQKVGEESRQPFDRGLPT